MQDSTVLDRQRDDLSADLQATYNPASRCTSDSQARHDEATGKSTTQSELESTSRDMLNTRGLAWLPDYNLPESFQAIRAQIDKGFNRRREAFVQQVFDKYKHKEPPGIPKSEKLTPALKDLGVHLSDNEAAELSHALDMDRDGWIDWPEFLHIANRGGKVQQWVRAACVSVCLCVVHACVRACTCVHELEQKCV
jgi:hypothetical protein